MKRLIASLFSFLLAACASAQITVTKSSDGLNNLIYPLNVPSGVAIEFRSGSTLRVKASGATFIFPSGSILWTTIEDTPTSAAGYGIANGSALDALGAVATNGLLIRTAPATYSVAAITGSGNVVYSNAPILTGTIAGASETLSGSLGVTGAVTGASFNGLTIPSTTGTLGVQDLKTVIFQNTLTFIGTDASTLNVGAGGTLGSNAFNSTAYQTPQTSAAGYGITNGANIDAWGALSIPAGSIVGTTATQALTNKTISGASNTLSAIGNGSLTNSAVTIGSTSVSLGGTASTIAGVTLTTPVLGVATATSLNGNTFTTGTGTLTLGSATLNAGAGGTLGSNAFTSTAYAPLASPTFTGTVTAAALKATGTVTLGSATGIPWLNSGLVGTATIGPNLTLTSGTLDTIQGIATNSTQSFTSVATTTSTASTSMTVGTLLNFTTGNFGSSHWGIISSANSSNSAALQVYTGSSGSNQEAAVWSTSGYLTQNFGMTVTGAATLSSTLNVTGATTLASSLNGVVQATSGLLSAGTISIANGGTNGTSATTAFNNLSPMTAIGQLIYGGTSGTGTALAANTSTTKLFLTETGTGSAGQAPAFSAIAAGDLPLATTGAFGAVKPDGTTITVSGGVISSTAGYSLPAATTAALGGVIVPTAGHITVDGSGNISIPQSVATSATPSFSTVTSTVSTGTPPFTVTSTTPVANLSIGGNAATATTAGTAASAGQLSNTFNINGVGFNGTASITVPAAASTLTGSTLASGVTASSLTTLGASLSGLIKATAGVLSNASAGTDYVAPGGAGAVSGLTTNGVVYAASATALATLTGATGARPVFATDSSGSGPPVFGALSFPNDFAENYSGATLTVEIFDPARAWTPTLNGFTIVNGTGAVTTTATYFKIGTITTVNVVISGTGTATIANAGGAFVSGSPYVASTPVAGSWVEGNIAAGGQLQYTGTSLFPTTWSAYTLANGPIYLTATFSQ